MPPKGQQDNDCPKHERCLYAITHPTDGALAKLHEKVNTAKNCLMQEIGKRITYTVGVTVLAVVVSMIGLSYRYTYNANAEMRKEHNALVNRQEKLLKKEDFKEFKEEMYEFRRETKQDFEELKDLIRNRNGD